MREIKFKGKRVDNGEWVYGYYLYDIEKDMHYIIPIVSDILCTPITYIEVKAETVGQYTGLKDKSGVEIYEGDIVKYKTTFPDAEHKYIKCKVYFYMGTGSNGYAIRHSYFFKKLSQNRVYNNLLKVIGNIHENPELLEDK